MFNTVVAALSAALLMQSPSALTARLTPEQAADLAQLMPDTARTVGTIGACERLYPELGPRLAPIVNSPTDDVEKAAIQEYLRQAYERGKVSAEAKTVTPQSCQAAIADLRTQLSNLRENVAAAQATAPTPEQMVVAERAKALVLRMAENLGSCEAIMPAGTAEQIRARFDKGDPEASRMLLVAYERGKASPAAAGRTMESCIADIGAFASELQSLQTELAASLSAD